MSDYWPEPDLPLFQQMAPAQQHSRTSMAAADSLEPETLSHLQRKVLGYIQQHPAGCTDEEIQRGLGINPSTERPRRIELTRRGLVVQAGERRTKSGRKACVWRAA